MTEVLKDILFFVTHGALVLHVALLGVAVWYIWRGANVISRLIAADLAGTLVLAMLVIYALITGRAIFIDVALGLGALGFIANILIAKYITDESAY